MLGVKNNNALKIAGVGFSRLIGWLFLAGRDVRRDKGGRVSPDCVPSRGRY